MKKETFNKKRFQINSFDFLIEISLSMKLLLQISGKIKDQTANVLLPPFSLAF